MGWGRGAITSVAVGALGKEKGQARALWLHIPSVPLQHEENEGACEEVLASEGCLDSNVLCGLGLHALPPPDPCMG